MIEWFTWLHIAVALVVGLVAIGLAIAKRGPNDVTVLGLGLVGALVLVELVFGVAGPAMGNPCLGDGLEWWMYLVAAVLIPPAAMIWALVERTRWSNLIIATAALGLAVMVFRMHTIWTLHAPGYA